MIRLKSEEDINQLAKAGKILARILDELSEMVAPNVSGTALETKAQQLMDSFNVKPAFLGYTSNGENPYPAALCISVNEAVVHGIPSEQVFQEGDVVSIDAGLIYEGKYYVDSARTVPVGSVSKEVETLIRVTEESLTRGIAAATVGARIGDIGYAIQSYVEGNGFGVVHQLVGHGVGFGVHEEPQVPNFGSAGTGKVLENGLVIAIEPMVTIGDPEVATAEDGWTISTVSGNLAAHSEHTVAITQGGPIILTQ